MTDQPVQAGHLVWFTPHKDDPMFHPDILQKLTATVAYVHNPRVVNLNVLDQNGMSHARGSVLLLNEGDPQPSPDECMFAVRQ
jgi:hypothetical protein